MQNICKCRKDVNKSKPLYEKMIPNNLGVKEAIALRLEAIALRLEAIALRLEAIRLRLEAIASN